VAPTTRICVYDRANVGRSDAAPWPITSRETISDLHVALHAAGVKPPYELLGASFGGLIAYVYAATYPDEVKGMVLLDAAFPQELGLERYFPPDQRLTHAEFKADREKLDQLDVYEQAQHLDPPRIPVTYLLAVPSTWTGPPAYNRVVLRRMADYVRGFAPGTLKRVRSPHYMEAAVPGTIAREVKALAARIRAQPTS
jgi:pimeloyl-ACP methyl ester carboxylesterase